MKKLKLPKRFPSSLQDRCTRHSVRRPETTFGCSQRQCRRQILICFYMGASKTQLWAAAGDGWTKGSTGNSTASRMQPEAVSFRAKLQHLLLPSPFHNWRIMFSPFTETLRCKSTDARPWIEATYFLLTTLQISSFLVVRTSPDARKDCPDMWLLLPWQLLDVQQTVNSAISKHQNETRIFHEVEGCKLSKGWAELLFALRPKSSELSSSTEAVLTTGTHLPPKLPILG